MNKFEDELFERMRNFTDQLITENADWLSRALKAEFRLKSALLVIALETTIIVLDFALRGAP